MIPHVPPHPLPPICKTNPRPHLLLLPRLRPRHLPRTDRLPDSNPHLRDPAGLHPPLPSPRCQQPKPLLHVLLQFYAQPALGHPHDRQRRNLRLPHRTRLPRRIHPAPGVRVPAAEALLSGDVPRVSRRAAVRPVGDRDLDGEDLRKDLRIRVLGIQLRAAGPVLLPAPGVAVLHDSQGAARESGVAVCTPVRGLLHGHRGRRNDLSRPRKPGGGSLRAPGRVSARAADAGDRGDGAGEKGRRKGMIVSVMEPFRNKLGNRFYNKKINPPGPQQMSPRNWISEPGSPLR